MKIHEYAGKILIGKRLTMVSIEGIIQAEQPYCSCINLYKGLILTQACGYSYKQETCINLYKGLIPDTEAPAPVVLFLALTSIRDWYLRNCLPIVLSWASCINLYKGLIRLRFVHRPPFTILALTSIRDWYLRTGPQPRRIFSCINLYKGLILSQPSPIIASLRPCINLYKGLIQNKPLLFPHDHLALSSIRDWNAVGRYFWTRSMSCIILYKGLKLLLAKIFQQADSCIILYKGLIPSRRLWTPATISSCINLYKGLIL